MRPMALSRFVSSNSSSVSERSLPRSPRKASSVRGRRPVAVGEVLPEELVQGGGGLRVGVLRLAQEGGELRPHRVDVDGHDGASIRAVIPILRARSTRPPRSSAGRSATKAARLASTRTRRSTTTRSRSTETRVAPAWVGLAGAATGGGWCRRARDGHATGGGRKADEVGGGVHAPDSEGGLCQLDCHGYRDI